MAGQDPPDDPASGAHQAHRSFADRLRERFGAEVDPEISLDGGPAEASPDVPTPAPASAASFGLIRRLTEYGLRGSRYRLEGEIARGGMGAILRVWDGELRRHLAMKVILRDADPGGGSAARELDARLLGRFLEEAQITGQLDHPGIVPVHELGLDSEGRVFFTMKLVKGRDLKQVLDLVREGKEGWNQTRALGVLLKACEAMGYAHAKGVIHRDLKPANVMVGNFGEVFVMDWGLARVLGRKDDRDLRLRAGNPVSLRSVRTDRREAREEAPDSPIVTLDGDVVGTPAYMSPEQARGEIEKLGPRSDVYSMGAMLYHLIAGEMPYVEPGVRVSNHTVLGMVLQGPPKSLVQVARGAPAELVAICEKAMARQASSRYADTLALAEDLRAYLEQRVVAAYETGAVAELKKWIARNRALAAASAAAVLILVVGLIVSATQYSRARAEAARADRKAHEAEASAELAGAARLEAEEERDRVLGLADMKRLADLTAKADTLWPALPDKIDALRAWLGRAQELVDRLPVHEGHLERVRAELAQHVTSDSDSPVETRTASGIEFVWLGQQLESLIAGIQAFAGTDPAQGVVQSVENRLAFALEIGEKSVASPDAAKRWSEAVASIRDPAQCSMYMGLVLVPEIGLLPIGRDPRSGLWEFALLQTGEPAVRGPDGNLVLKEETGLVLVLIPGGTFAMGAQKSDPTEANYDPQANPGEFPVHEVTLAPFFLSKYEMTQGQWVRFTGRNPSHYYAGTKDGGKPVTLLNPVEQVNWNECTEIARRLGLRLPTEAQWEYAARAGTNTVWWTGDQKESLEGAVNSADSFCRKGGAPSAWAFDDWLDDGWLTHAPVGTYRPNAFGLHEVVGNVGEWCRDGAGTYEMPVRAGDGERIAAESGERGLRGGGFFNPAADSRSAIRYRVQAGFTYSAVGLRPAKALANR